MNPRIYLDANATTPPFPEVVERMGEVLERHWGNPSSVHYEGREARRILEEAREEVAALLGVDPRELLFTSGGTEAINTFLQGYAWRQGNRLLILRSRGEHPAVENTLRFLESQGMAELGWLPTDPWGRVRVGELEGLLEGKGKGRPVLLVVIAAHNETGVLNPLAEMSAIASRFGIPVFADTVQWVGKLPLNLRDTGVTGAAVSAHKFGGPKGVGVLWVKPGILPHGILFGGPQERGRRGGTENLPGIAGMGVAARIVREELPRWLEVWREAGELLRTRSKEREKYGFPLQVYEVPEPHLPQTFMVGIGEWSGEEAQMRLDLEGVAVSYGSACSSGSLKASEVLLRLGLPFEVARRAVRISLPPRFSLEVMEDFLELCPRLFSQEPSLLPRAHARS